MTTAAARCDDGSGTALRWTACLVVMLGLHAGAAWMLLRHAPLMEMLPLPPEPVMVDLAPEPVLAPLEAAPAPPLPAPVPDLPASAEPPVPEPPPPEPAAAATPPEPQPMPRPKAILPESLSPPRPAPRQPAPSRLAPRRPPPHPAARPAPQDFPAQTTPALAPVLPSPASTAAPPSNAVPSWRSDVAGRLQRAKRYPEAARARGEQGVATETFTVDRRGRVLSASVVRSSSSRLLDEEAVALIHRAEPLPPMPADMPGSTATLTVPVTFSLR